MRHPTEHQQKAPAPDPAGLLWIAHPFFIKIRDVQAPVCAGLGEGGDIHLSVNTVCLKEISERDRCHLAPNGILFLPARRRATLPMFLNDGPLPPQNKMNRRRRKSLQAAPWGQGGVGPAAQDLTCPQGWPGIHCRPWETRNLRGNGLACGLCSQGVGRG